MEILTNNENVSEVPASEEIVTENTETKESSSEEGNKEINEMRADEEYQQTNCIGFQIPNNDEEYYEDEE